MRRFVEALPSDDLIKRHQETHRRRTASALHLLDAQRIPNMTRQELQGFLEDTDAWYGLRYDKQKYWAKVFGEADERLPALRDTLAQLVQRAKEGLTAADFDRFLSSLPGIGPGYLSEILALRFPERYWMWNKQVRDFLSTNGADINAELPRGKKTDEGEQYMAAGRHLEGLRHALEQLLGEPVDYLLTDLFIYWANQEGPDPWAEEVARLTREYFPRSVPRLGERERNRRASCWKRSSGA